MNAFTSGSGGPVDYLVDGEVAAVGVQDAVTAAVDLPAGEYIVRTTEPGDAGAVIVTGRVTVVAGRTTLYANHLDAAGEPTFVTADVTPIGQATGDDEAEFVAFHAAQAGMVSYLISGAEGRRG